MSFRSTLATAANRPYKRRLDCLQSAGAQYIDTGIVPDQSTLVEANVYMPATNAYRSIYGARTNASTLYEVLVYANSLYSQYGSSTPIISSTATDRWICLRQEGHRIFIDGALQYTHPEQEFSTGYNLTLFCNNKAGAKDRFYSGAKIKRVKIRNGGVAVRDLIPVLDNALVPCMYDNVSNAFFYNQGTGTFIYE